jgi:hypothetical protein
VNSVGELNMEANFGSDSCNHCIKGMAGAFFFNMEANSGGGLNVEANSEANCNMEVNSLRDPS